MPKIPTLQGPSVMPNQPYQQVGPVEHQADLTGVRLGNQLLKGVETVAGAYAEAEKKRKAEEAKAADEAANLGAAEGNLDFDTRANNIASEFEKTQGRDALAGRADAFTALDDARDEVAQGLTGKAREKFMLDSARAMQAHRRRLEGHASKEYEKARVVTLKAREHQGLAGAAAAADVPAYDDIVARTISDYRNNVGAEEAEAFEARFRGQAAEAYTATLLAEGRLDEADAFLSARKGELGDGYAKLRATLTTKQEAAKKDADAEERAARAQRLVDQAVLHLQTREDKLKKYPSEEDIRAGVNFDGLDDDTRKAAEAELNRTVAEMERAKRDEVNEKRGEVKLLDARGQPATEALEFLEEYDKDFIAAREINKAGKEKAAKAKNKKAAEDAQKVWDAQFRLFSKGMLNDAPNATLEDVQTAFTLYKKRQGVDVTYSPESELQFKLDADTEKQQASGSRSRVAYEFRQFIKPVMEKKKGKGQGVDEGQLVAVTGRYMDSYDEAVKANGGRPLDREAILGLMAKEYRIVSEEKTDKKPLTMEELAINREAAAVKRDVSAWKKSLDPGMPETRRIIRNSKTKKLYYQNADGSVGEEVPSGRRP